VELSILVQFQKAVPDPDVLEDGKMNDTGKIKPTLSPGFKDLSGDLLATKKKIIQIIEDNYLRYGYQEISQPSLEISSQIGSFLSEDETNPMSDVFLFESEK
jgi:histidyl-tRNA synthetase